MLAPLMRVGLGLGVALVLLAGCEPDGGPTATPTERDPQGNETPTPAPTPTAQAPSPTLGPPSPSPSGSETPRPNQAPEVTILSPADGATVEEGQAVTLDAQALDPEDGPLTGPALSWRSDAQGLLGTGAPLSVSILSVGPHTLTVSAVDSLGAVGLAQVAVTVVEVGIDQPPLVSITQPTDDARFVEGEAITLAGGADDPEDGALTGEALSWASDLGGPLGSGGALVVALEAGLHQLTLSAVDSYGNSGEASVRVVVSEAENSAPVALIASPQTGAAFVEGEAISLVGSATDAEDGELGGEALVWASSADGPLGTGAEVIADGLSVGAHRLTLTATDSGGQQGAASVEIRVSAAPVNQPPAVSILAPVDGRTVPQGEVVAFEGEALDPEDGPLTGASMTWASSQDGILGQGASVQAGALSLGTHTISLVALDSEGLDGVDRIAVTVTEAGVENLPPVARLAGPLLVREGEVSAFDGGASSDADGAVVRWRFDLGDGRVVDGTAPGVTHTFDGAGPWLVTLTVFDDDGASAAASLSVTRQADALSQTVVADTRSRLGSFCALGYDGDGRAAVAYSDDTHGGLFLAREGDGGAFASLLIDGYGLGVGGALWPGMDLAVEPAGDSHLAWLRSDGLGGYTLRYARISQGIVTDVTLGGAGPVSGAWPVSMAQTGAGLAVLYRSPDGREARLATCAGSCDEASSWATQTLLTVTAGGVIPGDLAWDALGGLATIHTLAGTDGGEAALQILTENDGAWQSSGPIPPAHPPTQGPWASRLTLGDGPLIATHAGVLTEGEAGWALSPIDPLGLSYFDILYNAPRREATLLNNHEGVIELLRADGRGYLSYDALTAQDSAWPQLAVDPSGDTHLCFARTGNVLVY